MNQSKRFLSTQHSPDQHERVNRKWRRICIGLGFTASSVSAYYAFKWWNNYTLKGEEDRRNRFADAVKNNKTDALHSILHERIWSVRGLWIDPNTVWIQVPGKEGSAPAVSWCAANGSVEMYTMLKRFGANTNVSVANEGLLETAARCGKWSFFDFIAAERNVTLQSYRQQCESVSLSTKHQRLIQQCEKHVQEMKKNPTSTASPRPTTMDDIRGTLLTGANPDPSTEPLRYIYSRMDYDNKKDPIDSLFLSNFARLSSAQKTSCFEIALQRNSQEHIVFCMLQGIHLEPFQTRYMGINEDTHRLFAHLIMKHGMLTPKLFTSMFKYMLDHQNLYAPVLTKHLKEFPDNNPLYLIVEMTNHATSLFDGFSWVYDCAGLKPFNEVTIDPKLKPTAHRMVETIRTLPECPRLIIMERLTEREAKSSGTGAASS